ncbi:MAG: DUF1365 domain-containing protein [Planctomycetota bacterium]|nr:MAG: DUF1365 domain-containing protein [Planctomycetota bacterium]
MQSCIYEGRVRHRRHAPVRHAFDYGLFLMYLDLAELPALFRRRALWSVERFNLAQFRRGDHHGDPAVPLDTAIRSLVEARTGRRPAGPIRILTHLRYFGYVFNPVSFYYCFDPDDRRVETIVAEINNTPWGEQHCYVLPVSSSATAGAHHRFRLRKDFHISPFMDMNLAYDWRFTEPGRRLAVHMESYDRGKSLLDVTMSMTRRAISGPALARVLARYPLMTARVITAIYWQALRLRLKKVPFFAHPKYRQPPLEAGST